MNDLKVDQMAPLLSVIDLLKVQLVNGDPGDDAGIEVSISIVQSVIDKIKAS